MLLMEPIAIVGLVSRISRRVEAKNRNKIGDKVDLYRILVVCGLFLSIKAPSLS